MIRRPVAVEVAYHGGLVLVDAAGSVIPPNREQLDEIAAALNAVAPTQAEAPDRPWRLPIRVVQYGDQWWLRDARIPSWEFACCQTLHDAETLCAVLNKEP